MGEQPFDLCADYSVEPFEPSLGNNSGNKRPAIFSAEELRQRVFPPIRYIVPGYVAEGCSILAGRPKLGKSWLMLELAIGVASGAAVLGLSQPCEQGDVLYCALEDNQRRLQRRIDRVVGAFAQSWPASLKIATEWPRANEGGLEAIREWIEAAPNPRLVIVDVLAMFRPAQGPRETLYQADYHAIKGLQALAGEFGVAIIVVTHTRKSQGEGDPFEKVSGTLGLSGGADTVLVLDRDSNGCTLYGRGRDVEEIDTAVAFDRDTCRWRILGAAAEVRRTDERGAILTALADAGEPMSPTELADVTLMQNQNIRQLLVSMLRAGEVVKEGRGRYRHPDHIPTPDHNDHKITSEEGYRRPLDPYEID